MQRKKFKRFLFRSSFRLYVLYMISTIMLISIFDNSSWKILLGKIITMLILTLIIFIVNIEIIAFFRKPEHRKHPFRNKEKRIFAAGFLFTLLLFSLHYIVSSYLANRGIITRLPDRVSTTNWKEIMLVLFSFSLIEYTFIYLLQNFTLSQHEKNQFELEVLQLKASNAETANQLLQQQIKPHFLFNALTTLKSLIRKKPDTAENYLIRLSDFLRASFANTGSKSGLIQVAEELIICHNYMEMQKVRFGEALRYQVQEPVTQCSSEHYVPAFALQSLLENAIKHNMITNANPLIITMNKTEDYITVSNNLQPKTTMETSTGKGLSNLKERYRLISGDEVKVKEETGQFSVSIKILNP